MLEISLGFHFFKSSFPSCVNWPHYFKDSHRSTFPPTHPWAFFFSVLFIYFLYHIVLVLPNIDMNLPWVYMCSHPEPPSHLPPHPIPLGHPSAPAWAPCLMHRTWTGDSFHIWYFTHFNAILPYHPARTLSQCPKDCSIHLCLFCCLTYRVIVTIFLNSIYMH